LIERFVLPSAVSYAWCAIKSIRRFGAAGAPEGGAAYTAHAGPSECGIMLRLTKHMPSNIPPAMPVRRRRRPKEERYEEVLAAAAKIISERGYPGATIHEIASELRVTPAALYHYVDSKEELLFEICTRAGEHLLQHANEVLASDGRPKEKLRQLFYRHLKLIESDRAIFMILIQEQWGDLTPARVEELRRRDRQYFDTVRKIFDLFDPGVLRVKDARLATLAMLGMLNWVIRWYREDGPYDLDEIAEEFFEIFSAGILAQR
jgi:AcrR family transcriptional regulator